jgi:hypothetical protein
MVGVLREEATEHAVLLQIDSDLLEHFVLDERRAVAFQRPLPLLPMVGSKHRVRVEAPG